MSHLQSWNGTVLLSATVKLPFITHAGDLIAAAPDATPTFVVYNEDFSATLIASTNSAQIGAVTGNYTASVDVTTGNGFEAGKKYTALVTYAISATTYYKHLSFQVG